MKNREGRRSAAGRGASPEWLVIVLGILVWIAFQRATGIVLEDALITYRCAGNLAAGHGLVFNPGERVLGTTTPLFALLLAGLGWIFGVDRIPLASFIVLLLCSAGTTWLIAATIRRWGLGTPTALIGALAFALHPDTLWATGGGMEPPMLLLWMAASLWALSCERWSATAVFAGLVVLTRPDGLVWSGTILAALCSVRGRAAVRELALFGLVLAPWLVVATLYYGSPVPQSLIAKSVVVGAEGPLVLLRPSTLRGFLTHFAGWMPFPPEGGFSPFEFAAGVGLIGWGARRVWSLGRRPAQLALLAFPPLFALAFYLARAPLSFPWYGLPVTWATLLLLAIGSGEIAEELRRRARASVAVGPGVWSVLLLTAGLLSSSWCYEMWRTYQTEKGFQENEVATRKTIGEWLARHTRPGATVAMEAIGYQGAYSRRRVIDLAGLVSPEVTRLRRQCDSNAEVYRAILDRLRPDYLVLRSFEVDENRCRDGGPLFASADAESTFHRTFHEVLRVHAPHVELWGDLSHITVYARRDALNDLE